MFLPSEKLSHSEIYAAPATTMSHTLPPREPLPSRWKFTAVTFYELLFAIAVFCFVLLIDLDNNKDYLPLMK